MRRALALLLVATGAVVTTRATAIAQAPPSCAPGGAPVELSGAVAAADARTYLDLAFTVEPGTTRVEVTYDWQGADTVLDLGLWDADGFRGWSGSRGGRVAAGQAPVFVQPDVAARGYAPGPIEPGPWSVDLGIATVGSAGATWQVTVTCTAPAVGAPFVPDPVDPTHVADTAAGWYHGDLHMHGFHSNANAPTAEEIVDTARDRGLDFMPITDYVTGQHWDELGAVQRANPDVVVWPGREIITYFGHANALGETRSMLDYRHGHNGLTLRDIQEATLAEGALFQVNHPDFFPPPLGNLCRGCYFELGDVVDWSRVDTIEVVTGPVLASTSDLGLPGTPTFLQNPFVQPAIERWESLLRAGFDITAVSGSDSKGVETEPERRGYGSSATAVYSQELSRPALIDALREGRAYVRARGAQRSPEVDFTATTADSRQAMIGDTLVADAARMTVTIRGGAGQTLSILRDGEPFGLPVPVTTDPFTFSWDAQRIGGSGPLGTFWRLDVADAQSLTIITNPIFLTGTGDPPPTTTTSAPPSSTTNPPRTTILARSGTSSNAWVGVLGAGLVAIGAVLVLVARRNEQTFV